MINELISLIKSGKIIFLKEDSKLINELNNFSFNNINKDKHKRKPVYDYYKDEEIY